MFSCRKVGKTHDTCYNIGRADRGHFADRHSAGHLAGPVFVPLRRHCADPGHDRSQPGGESPDPAGLRLGYAKNRGTDRRQGGKNLGGADGGAGADPGRASAGQSEKSPGPHGPDGKAAGRAGAPGGEHHRRYGQGHCRGSGPGAGGELRLRHFVRAAVPGLGSGAARGLPGH